MTISVQYRQKLLGNRRVRTFEPHKRGGNEYLTGPCSGCFSSKALPISQGLAGILACSPSALSSHVLMAAHSDVKIGLSVRWSLQQRDCAGLAPASLLAPFVRATKPAAKIHFFFVLLQSHSGESECFISC